jgi:hypothetical protein
MGGLSGMSERTQKFEKELDRLIDEGFNLWHAIRYECYPENFRNTLKESVKDTEKINNFIKNLPKFKEEYQSWYSESLSVIKQVLPDRVTDFISYFEFQKPRKNINFQNYMIRDYLQCLEVSRLGDVIADGSAAIPEFRQQLNILQAARSTLGSVLMDLKSVVQADLFDSETDSAAALAKAGHLRAAGALCGVVIEKHLAHVCEMHGLKIKKKCPSISDYIEILKNNNLIDTPNWRQIQYLSDIRNLCTHKKERDPKKEEIQELIDGTHKVLKTVF